MLRTIGHWLWNSRKSLIPSLIAVGGLELVFYQANHLGLWLGCLAACLAVGVWWVTAFSFRSRRLWLLIAQLLWITAGIVSFVIFSIVNVVQFQLAALVAGCLWWWLLSLYEYYALNGVWPVRALPLVDFVDLLAFFFVGVGVLLAADFYSWSAGWLVALFAVEVGFALYLRFWREEISGLRKWLYAGLVVWIVEQLAWVSSYWHRGVYLKTFFAAVIFYLLADFTVHYLKNRLTVRVALEYVGLVLAALVAVLVVDGFLVLR